MADTRAEVRRLANLLMVGHGGALLLIFNARTQDGLDPYIAGRLQDFAWFFAVGLIAACLMVYMALRHDMHGGMTFSGEASIAKHQAEQDRRGDTIGWAFIVSAAAFVGGLVFAIATLEPQRAPAENRAPIVATVPASPQNSPPAEPMSAPEIPVTSENTSEEE